ncbi:hypothetical protein QVD17_07043 [Tagetes erecta]|uniref:Uncharacterized protein n=1 Tax=Tagetes erecta TaxID=13708 RepID=A0AAD8LGP5_TARER|nr:hypothetical protein QVD17_07043 [Tagetes erecta]
MQSIQCDEPHRELLCCGIHRPEVSHEVSFELQGATKDSQSAINAVEKVNRRENLKKKLLKCCSRAKISETTVMPGNEDTVQPGKVVCDMSRVISMPGEDSMTTVWPGNEHVKSMPGEEVIDICRVTSCVTIQPGEEMLLLYSRMENLKFEPKHNLVACLDESIP